MLSILQGPAALATVLIVGISHFFWQKHCDRKAGTLPHEIGTTTVIKAGSNAGLLCSATYATDPDGRWLIGDFCHRN